MLAGKYNVTVQMLIEPTCFTMVQRVSLTIFTAYPVVSFGGTKRVILTTTSWMGGKNTFLGVAYIVVGLIATAVGVMFSFMHIQHRTRLVETRRHLEVLQTNTYFMHIPHRTRLLEPSRHLEVLQTNTYFMYTYFRHIQHRTRLVKTSRHLEVPQTNLT